LKEVPVLFETAPEELLRILNGTVEALSSLCQKIDPYTANHQRRVARLACDIAEKMGLSDEQAYGLRVMGMVHDIGKVVLPDDILSKDGELNEEEFQIIKTHPQVAYDVLKNLAFPWPVAQTVLQHHERMDGSGYPNQLAGKEIILEARILSVADVIESMITHRPYRRALGMEKALEEIELNSGVLYDPEVTHACFKLTSNGGIKFD
jgi:HD-GYP domain-containing protein (c-di-GMP phosphodiesterase class II)